MMEMMSFRRLGLKTKQERKPYSSLLGYSDFRKTSSLILLTNLADSQLTVLHSWSSQFACLMQPTRPSILLKQLSRA
jgi:hypothetical protein